MLKGLKVAALLATGALALAACGSSSGGSTSSSPAASGSSSSAAASPSCTPSDIKVGMAYDIGGRGDKSFNDSAAAGLDQAVKAAARGTDNVLYPLRDALRARATVGEVSDALRDVWGLYVPADVF